MHGGRNIIRRARIPKPVVLVDTRERKPFRLDANHPNWIGGERKVVLKTGDYTVLGMEHLLALERKSLADLVACTVTYVSHQGERPIAITWRLHHRLSGDLFAEFAAAVA